jgi:flagellar basal body-associated protein FliL
MSQIRSLKDATTREAKRKRISGIVIIALLLLSTIGFALSMVNFGGQTTTPQAEQGFSTNGQYWIYTAASRQYYFTHHVDEVNISSYNLTKNLADYAGQQVYLDAEIPGSVQEIYTNLGSYTSRLNEACYGKCNMDLPEKDCTEKLIVVRESPIPSITEQDSCVFINGDMKTVDAFLYKVLGIN